MRTGLGLSDLGACASKVSGTVCLSAGCLEGLEKECLLAWGHQWEVTSVSLGPSWKGLPLPARPAVTWPDDGFQQGDSSGQELQLSLLLQEAL